MDTLGNDQSLRASKSPQLQRVTFRTSRLLDFCSEKELTAQTGHPPNEWPLVIVKELIDNALDACEEGGIAPHVTVTVDAAGISVTDNGPGLLAQTIKGILDYTVRVSSREAYASPTRGAQGNALKTILAMPFVLDGQRGRVEIEAKGIRHSVNFSVDQIRQEPLIEHATEVSSVTTGAAVRVWWPNSPRSILDDAKARFLQVADDFTWLNPHLTLTVDWLGERTTVEATIPSWAKWKPSDPTCPHWYETQHLERLIAAYLAHDQDQAGRQRTAREFIAEFRGLSGTAKQKAVLDATGLSREPLSRLIGDGRNLDKDLVGKLLAAMQANSKPVKSKALGIIGEDHLRRRFEAIGCEMESFQYRKIEDDDGLPSVVEVAFGWCPDADGRRLVTGVNWSASIVNLFRQLGTHGESLDSLLAQERAAADEPMTLVLHQALPRARYTDRGKSAVASNDTRADKIIGAVKAVTKKWAKQRKAEERHNAAIQNRRYAMTRSYRITIKDAAWAVMEEAYLKASANGTLPAHARQIMYAARPFVQELRSMSSGWVSPRAFR
jgi:DNA topoisomerase VI subunit B